MAKRNNNSIAITGDLDQLLSLVGYINSLALATRIVESGDSLPDGPVRKEVIQNLLSAIDNLSLQAGAHVEFLDARRAA